MAKKHIISLAGKLASGKGTVSKILSNELGYNVYRNGEYARELARKMNKSITEFNIYVKDHPEIDNQIENSAAEYANTHDNFIIDARLGWYAVPYSFKVYLTVDLDVAAYRAFHDPNRKSTEKFNTIEEQKEDMNTRFHLENERYYKLYKVRQEDMSNYDLVIDTTYLEPNEVAIQIKEAYLKWLEA